MTPTALAVDPACLWITFSWRIKHLLQHTCVKYAKWDCLQTNKNRRLNDLRVLWVQQKCRNLQWLGLCEPSVHVNNRSFTGAPSDGRNREVIVQLDSLQLLFIRGVKAGGDCLSAATGPLLHVDDCNEQKVALADNCQRTTVSQLTSIISLAAQFAPLCPFSLLFFLFSNLFYYPAITAYLQW